MSVCGGLRVPYASVVSGLKRRSTTIRESFGRIVWRRDGMRIANLKWGETDPTWPLASYPVAGRVSRRNQAEVGQGLARVGWWGAGGIATVALRANRGRRAAGVSLKREEGSRDRPAAVPDRGAASRGRVDSGDRRHLAANGLGSAGRDGAGPARAVPVRDLRGGPAVDDEPDVPEVRPPTLEDVRTICRALQEAGARYVLIGGFAVILHGGERTTKDIDLLVDPGPENVERLKRARSVLEDGAAGEIDPGDLQKYRVVRVADEVMVDLLAAACAVTWAEANETALRIDLDGTPVVVADADTLIRTKRTIRPSDAADRAFLEALRDENH